MKKHLPLLLLPLVFCACASDAPSPKVTPEKTTPAVTQPAPAKPGLVMEKCNAADLAELESIRLDKINVEGLTIAQALKNMSDVYNINAQGAGLKALPLKMDEAAITEAHKGKTIEMRGEDPTFRQIFENICSRNGLNWWVDGALYIELCK